MIHPRPNYNNVNSIPVLHIEESVKKYYDVKSKHGHTHRKKYYDIDWRFYIVQKYGRYMVCGTRCPMREYYNVRTVCRATTMTLRLRSPPMRDFASWMLSVATGTENSWVMIESQSVRRGANQNLKRRWRLCHR